MNQARGVRGRHFVVNRSTSVEIMNGEAILTKCLPQTRNLTFRPPFSQLASCSSYKQYQDQARDGYTNQEDRNDPRVRAVVGARGRVAHVELSGLSPRQGTRPSLIVTLKLLPAQGRIRRYSLLQGEGRSKLQVAPRTWSPPNF